MKFSVLISVYDKEKAEYLHGCLQSIADQTLKPSEIVLVKDGSLNQSLEQVITKWQTLFQNLDITLKIIPLALPVMEFSPKIGFMISIRWIISGSSMNQAG